MAVRLGGAKGVILEVRTIASPNASTNGSSSNVVADARGAENFGAQLTSSGPGLFTGTRDEAPDYPAPSRDAAPQLFTNDQTPPDRGSDLASPLLPDPVLSEHDFAEAAAPVTSRPSILDELREPGLDEPEFDFAPPPPDASGYRPQVTEAPRQTSDPSLDGHSPLTGDAQPPGATGGYPAVRLGPNSTVISDSAIRLSIDGQDYSFLPGAAVTVGRDPNCLIQVDEKHSLVSRRHLELTFDDGSWWIDDSSSKGTFIDNKRIGGRYRAEGAFVAHLGDDDAGTPMKVITAGEHRTPRQFNLLAVAALASIALIPLILMAFLINRNGSPSGEPDFVTAKQATVMLFGLEGGQGSGFFVADNLIVTNQHVAVLSPQMLVGVSRQTDEPAQIEYATELVANHPYLDIAVLRISNKAMMTNDGPQISSEPVGDIDLPSVPIGDSDDITIGDEVFSTGFPDRLSITSQDDAGELRLPPVAATSGEAASFTIWPGCSNPDFGAFIPATSPPGVACAADGDVNKGVLRSTFSSGQGASGSAVFRNNEVVAVVYAGDADDLNTSLNITSAAFQPWLQDIIDSNS